VKRPDQHITETKSQRIFERIVPAEWVCREIKPDYGVDYLVEIFDNNQSTGKTFFVQLKGSTQKIKDDKFEKQFTTDNLKYYNSLALPVLIICVSVTTEQIWGIWANKLIDQKTLRKDQKTISLSLEKKYLLDETSFVSIASQTDVVNKIGLFTEADSDLGKSFNEHLLRWVDHFFSNSVSVKFNHLPNHLDIKLSSLKEPAQLTIDSNSYTKDIDIEGLNENLPFLYRPEFNKDDINEYNKEALLSIALALAKYDIKGTIDLLAKVCGEIDFSNQNRWTELDPLGLLKLSILENELLRFNRFVQELINRGHYEMFLFFDLAYFVLSTDELQKLRVENLKTVIEKTSDNQVKGTCHYNIGNILRPTQDIAIEHYFEAAKLFPDYLNRPYWWREIAGLLFGKRHYNWAEKCYRKSLERLEKSDSEKKYFRLEKTSPREENLVTALIADCLFLQGKFSDANSLFEEYFKATSHISQEWVLKNMTCIELKNGKLDNVKFDRKGSMKLCEESLSAKENKDIIKALTKATELHPTNGLAWFNLGVALDKDQKFEEALFAFLMTGLIQDGDKEAQFNALTISFTQGKLDMMQAILVYISEKYDSTVLNDLSDYIMNKNIPLDSKKELIKAFTGMMEVIKNNAQRFVYSAYPSGYAPYTNRCVS
jgi:tetratricopeptide (TPR) repeat protein